MSHNSSFTSGFTLYLRCLTSRPAAFIFTTVNITFLLLILPLCTFILHHGLQLWRQKKHSASSGAAVSHSDFFAYHMVVIELFGVLASVLVCCGVYMEDFNVLNAAGFLSYFCWFGENFFHVLTCVERYLAVVHPVTYLSLRNQRGIRIRNVTVGGGWLLCLAGMGSTKIQNFIVIELFTVMVTLTVVSFCSLSVLCVLIRPRPGEQGGGRERVDQSKTRAFYTITAILGVMTLRFALSIIWSMLHLLVQSQDCVILACAFWLTVPSSLVLPLLFLHRSGKLVCWKKNNQ